MWRDNLVKNVQTVVGIALLLVVVYIADFFLDVNRFGILPRHVASLPFIFTAPFLHGSLVHLISNLIGLSIFSFILLQQGRKYFYSSCLFIIIFSGLFVWLIGREAIHLGASGVIFGLWSLIIFRAFFERKFLYIVLATLVVFFHGGMVFGLLPTARYVSFEAHIGGALGGVLFAYIMHKKVR